ncbi:MAG TPA: FKBP-type peptidyl-prolyl cis-trans isomerase [Elusimicrobiales bacterium]|nr:FKBP-type peptidyl-prolyl cis-trans isomerase [Elusimicrobiales bacterium]
MKKTVFALAAALLLPVCANAADTSAPDKDTLYTLGFLTARNLGAYDLSKDEIKQVLKGVEDAAAGKKSTTELASYLTKIQELGMNRWKSKATSEKTASEKFLAEHTKAAGVQKLADGIWIKHSKEGTGPAPDQKDIVKVHYEGKLRDGKVFDSSRQRGTPVSFPLEGVIPCWQKAIAAMKKGGTATIYCAASAAYDEMGNPPVIPGNAALVFDTELIDIEKPAPEPAASAKKEAPKAKKDAPAKVKKPEAKK